jgi:hypothetical protein
MTLLATIYYFKITTHRQIFHPMTPMVYFRPNYEQMSSLIRVYDNLLKSKTYYEPNFTQPSFVTNLRCLDVLHFLIFFSFFASRLSLSLSLSLSLTLPSHLAFRREPLVSGVQYSLPYRVGGRRRQC